LPASGFDKGADLVLTLDGVRTAVQAKRSSTVVGIGAVRQLLHGRTRSECWDRRTVGEYVAGDPPNINLTVCADCGASVSPGVTKWCLDHPGRFDGNVFCLNHQRRSQRRVAQLWLRGS
jgi:hypothetical protein